MGFMIKCYSSLEIVLCLLSYNPNGQLVSTTLLWLRHKTMHCWLNVVFTVHVDNVQQYVAAT